MYGHFLQVLLTKCVLSISANFDLSPESEIEFVIEKAQLRNPGMIIKSTTVNCTAEGAFVINCTSIKVCYDLGVGYIIGVELTCPEQENFNPDTMMCDPEHVCPVCTREGFVCLTNTSFTLCSDVLEEVVSNVTCPGNHCCHEAFRLPCMNKTPTRSC